jgi:DNA-binding MarR family transcriptional regulator
MAARNRNAILDGIVHLRRAIPSINLTAAMVFFYIAENPGINVTELAEICGIEISTASRIVRSLASPSIEGALPPFHGFVEIFDNIEDLRGRVLYLSEAGRRLCEQLEGVIARATPIAA